MPNVAYAKSQGAPRPVPGKIELKFRWRTVTVFGGPFRDKPRHMAGVKLQPTHENPEPCDVHCPIRDFGVPDEDVAHAALRQALRLMLVERRTLYVGCMGGTGRTGLFLGLLLKVAGSKNPLKDVRATYKAHAVETRDQERFLARAEVDDLARTARRMVLAGPLARFIWPG